MQNHPTSASFNSPKVNSFLQKRRTQKRGGFGQGRGFNHLSIKVSEPIPEEETVSLFKYDDFSPIVDSFVNSAAAVAPSDNQFPSPTPTPTCSNFHQPQYPHPLSQVMNCSDMNEVAHLSATTPVSANFSNIQSPAFPVWSYSSPISPVFPSGSNDVFFNNSMMNTSNSLAIDPLYTSMHFTTTIPCHMDSDLEKIDPDVPIHPENFASDVSSSIKPSFLLQGASFVNESPSPQLVPDQLSPTFSSALMTPTTENFPNMLYVPWEVGLMDPQCGLIDFSTPQTPTKFEMPGLTDMPLSATQLSFNPNPALNILNSPTADNFQSSNTNVSNVSQVYTCTYPNCKKTFSCIYNLRSHYRIHSTERPFKCDSCQQSFSRNHDLKRHQKIHLGIKPYRCTKCDRTFGRLDALKRHTLVKRCAERASKEKLPHSTGTYIAPGRATASIEPGNEQAEASISA